MGEETRVGGWRVVYFSVTFDTHRVLKRLVAESTYEGHPAVPSEEPLYLLNPDTSFTNFVDFSHFVTKYDLETVRSELKRDLEDLRSELKQDLAEVYERLAEVEMKCDYLEAKFESLEERFDFLEQEVDDFNSKLLTVLEKYKRDTLKWQIGSGLLFSVTVIALVLTFFI